jgi:hypothetical protein
MPLDDWVRDWVRDVGHPRRVVSKVTPATDQVVVDDQNSSLYAGSASTGVHDHVSTVRDDGRPDCSTR